MAERWVKAGNIRGPAGAPGPSNYDLWLQAGNTGSVDDFLESLRGPAGADGEVDPDLFVGVNDPRLTDARTPTAHSHPQSQVTGLTSALSAKADLVGGVIPTSQLPAVATGQTVTVASQAAMLALTSAQVQPGDVAIRSDLSGRRFLLSGADPSVLGSWIGLETPDAVSSVNGQQGAVVLGFGDVGAADPNDGRFPSSAQKNALGGTSGSPSNSNRYVTDADPRMTNARAPIAHSHAVEEVTGLTAALDDRVLITVLTALLDARRTDVQVFSTSGNWSKPSGARAVLAFVLAGGGGGGSARVQENAFTNAASGGGGGAGGGATRATFSAAELDATVPVVVGSGGPGGAARTGAVTTNGFAGTAGSPSSFGPIRATGGNAGNAGTTAAAAASTAGLGNESASNGGASSITGNAANVGANSAGLGATGGGGGGGRTITAGTPNKGGLGGPHTLQADSMGVILPGGGLPTGAAGSGSNGLPGLDPLLLMAGGTGGSGAISGSGLTPGGTGGAGGRGAGGGGGGAGEVGAGSGAGGKGGDGLVVVVTYF